MKKLCNKGSIAIVLCLLITALLGFTAYVVDIGMIFIERVKLSNSLDSAALAAILELPNDDAKAMTVAVDYLQKNNIDPNQVNITIGVDHKSIQMYGSKNVKHLFAQIMGIKSNTVIAKTKAVLAPVRSAKGIRPFAVEAFNFSYGDLVTLKHGAGDGYHGNYGAISLGGSGASIFSQNALYGFSGSVSVGDYINTETGDMTGACNEIKNYINSEFSVFNNFPRDSIRIWTIPLVDSLEVNGQKSVLIVGFAVFYLEEVTKNSGKIELNGRFIRYVINSTVDETLNDTGAYGAKLSR